MGCSPSSAKPVPKVTEEFDAKVTEEFGVFGCFASADVKETIKLNYADAEIQVKEEPRATRYSLMKTPTGGDIDSEKPQNKVYWVAAFENKEAYDVDHKERKSNQEYTKKLFPTGANKDNPMMNLSGSYMGPIWHVERSSGATVQNISKPFITLSTLKAKSAEEAEKALASIKDYARTQAVGPLRITLVRVADGIMPGPKDATTLQWVQEWSSESDYKDLTQAKKTIDTQPAVVSGETLTVIEFNDAQHFR
eukprot:jgi/Bigna1/86723/estExt_fgenesh1_pg.C_130069